VWSGRTNICLLLIINVYLMIKFNVSETLSPQCLCNLQKILHQSAKLHWQARSSYPHFKCTGSSPESPYCNYGLIFQESPTISSKDFQKLGMFGEIHKQLKIVPQCRRSWMLEKWTKIWCSTHRSVPREEYYWMQVQEGTNLACVPRVERCCIQLVIVLGYHRQCEWVPMEILCKENPSIWNSPEMFKHMIWS
jgi:hypothetical protein